MQTRQIRLADIATDFLAVDPRFRTTSFQIYSCASDLEIVSEKFFSKVTSELKVDRDHPLVCAVGRFPNFELWLSHEFQYVSLERKFIFFSKIDKITLPETSLVIFASPDIHEDDKRDEGRARAVIDVYKSILIGFFGRGFLLDQISNFSIEGYGEHKTSYGSQVWRVPQLLDCRALVDSAIYDDLIKRIPFQIEPLRSQIALACQFFSSAIDESQEYKRFFDYWTALEIIAQGKSLKIKSILGKAYGVKADTVDTKLGFKEISDIRHQLIHQGTFIRFEPETERRMQGIFLDVMRQQLGLPCGRITEQPQT